MKSSFALTTLAASVSARSYCHFVDGECPEGEICKIVPVLGGPVCQPALINLSEENTREASAQSFRDFLDAFNQDPKGTLDFTQDAIIRELNNDVDQRAIRLEQGQRDIEEGWDQLIQRANALNLQQDHWTEVRAVVDGLNQLGQDPSAYMTASRDQIIAQMRADAWQLNADLEQVKCAILAELDIPCQAYQNLSAATPEWEVDLDYAQGDAYIAELTAAYNQHNEDMMRMFTEWGQAKQTIDNYYWTYEFQPQLEEWAALDEQTLRTIITWIVDGTKVKGTPLVEVFPGVQDYMLNNFNAQGLNLQDKFGLNGSPLVLQATEWMYADWWTYVGCVQETAYSCQWSPEPYSCVNDVAFDTCNGFDTWDYDFYTCYISEGERCDGLWEWAVQYTDEAYWAGADDYDYSLWLAQVEPTPAGPVVFSFDFDPNEVNTWLDEQDSLYELINGRYNDEMMAYVDRIGPLYNQINQENEALQARLESIDALTEEQLTSTFYDVGAWLEENFAADEMYVSLAGKVKSSSSGNNQYAIYGGSALTLAAVSAIIYAQSKREEKSTKTDQMQDSFIPQ